MKKLLKILLSLTIIISSVFCVETVNAETISYDRSTKKITIGTKEYNANLSATTFVATYSSDNFAFGTYTFEDQSQQQFIFKDGIIFEVNGKWFSYECESMSGDLDVYEINLDTSSLGVENGAEIELLFMHDEDNEPMQISDVSYSVSDQTYFSLEIHEDSNDGLHVSVHGDCPTGQYTLSISSNSKSLQKNILINVTNNGNLDDDDEENALKDNEFIYNNVKYRFGLGNLSSDNETLHIDDGNDVDYDTMEFIDLIAAVAEISGSDNSISGTASQDIANMILNDSVIKNTDYTNVAVNTELDLKQGETSDITIKDANNNIIGPSKVLVFNNKVDNSKAITLKYRIPVPKTIGKHTYTVTCKNPAYDEDGDDTREYLKYYFDINVKAVKTMTFDVDNIISSEDNLSNLNNIFSSKSNLESFIGTNLTDEYKLTFKFDSQKVYTGTITLNCREAADRYEIYFVGGDDPTENGSYSVTYGPMATLKGGIINKAGLYSVRNINFENYNNVNNGISAIGEFSNDGGINCASDVAIVQGCKFKNYKNAIYSYGSGLVSGISKCWFENNDNAIYINSSCCNSYGDSLNNTFVNNKIGINFVRNPKSNSYNFVISNNYFFNNDNDANNDYLDYKVSAEGTYFFIKCYYGNNLDDGFTDNNYRNPRVSSSNNTEVVTGPLIKYPEQTDIYGFNTRTGACNKLNNNATFNLHLDELVNLSNEVSIDIYDNSANKDKGSLVFGGNE